MGPWSPHASSRRAYHLAWLANVRTFCRLEGGPRERRHGLYILLVRVGLALASRAACGPLAGLRQGVPRVHGTVVPCTTTAPSI